VSEVNRDRFWTPLGVLTTIVGVIVALAALILAHRDAVQYSPSNNHPAATSSNSSGAAPPPASAVAPSTGNQLFLDGNDLALFNRLALSRGGAEGPSCRKFWPGGPLGIFTAAIICNSTDPPLSFQVIYYQLSDRASFARFLSDMSAGISDMYPCAGTPEPHVGNTWWGTDGVVRGQMLCRPLGTNIGMQYQIIWGAPTSLIAAMASDANPTTVYNWWRAHADVVPQ
jgi:hypothetical protein